RVRCLDWRSSSSRMDRRMGEVCQNPPVIRLDAFAALLEYRHGLGVYCPNCRRWADMDLRKLVMTGQGDRVFIGIRARCADCGGLGDWQVRPPVIPMPTAYPRQ